MCWTKVLPSIQNDLHPVRLAITKLAIGVIQLANSEKDNMLAWELHILADQYSTRPTGQWDWKPEDFSKEYSNH
jgi:hypothetical protein